MYNILLIFENFNFKGRPMRRTRRTPKSQPILWNLYEAAMHGLARTNNGLEGWHNGFQKQVGGHHVSIWKMFEGLQREVGLAKLKVAHVEAGKEENQKLKWKRTTENIKTKVENYSNQDIIPYLKSLAYNIDFKFLLNYKNNNIMKKINVLFVWAFNIKEETRVKYLQKINFLSEVSSCSISKDCVIYGGTLKQCQKKKS